MRTVLFLAIVKNHTASFFLEKARQAGARGGTIIRAEGTINHPVLNFLGLHDSKREALLMLVEKTQEEHLHRVLEDECHLSKKGEGVLFSFDTTSVYGSQRIHEDFNEEENGLALHQLIVTIVDRDLGDEVVEAARQVGASGATILHGRGLGSKKESKIFNIQIEPEKELVLMVVESKNVTQIVQAIDHELDINRPGAGIVFTMNVNNATGLFEGV
ncbi:P-II family nitrogen regulator [Facklamia hominis]|uniref:P-II family nitrogen regulator n=1 Tax=Facklamia hominis TaxID=178214 RepID=A0AAJ1Q4J7_9LACT|nr:P-II family nitrogen regulator [Facklamia hominis]MDK7186749.1 P-II family nitrogen regulator [Facklamia hominis]